MSGRKETYVYGALKERIAAEWKIFIVGIFVMTGTFLGSCLWDQMILTLTGTI